MKSYYRLMLGEKSKHAAECLTGGFVGTDFHIHQDLTSHLPDNWREFNKAFIPVYLGNTSRSQRSLRVWPAEPIWAVSKGMFKGDIILVPRWYWKLSTWRNRWRVLLCCRSNLCTIGELSTGSAVDTAGGPEPGTEEFNWRKWNRGEYLQLRRMKLRYFFPGQRHQPSQPPTIRSKIPSTFAMEKHLEEFLVSNWSQTELGKEYNIFTDEGQIVGQQYPTDTGPIDILAISKDGKKLLVVELKRGRASDVVVGQILRYMGYVQDELAESNQTVQGVIIALEDDPKAEAGNINGPQH